MGIAFTMMAATHHCTPTTRYAWLRAVIIPDNSPHRATTTMADQSARSASAPVIVAADIPAATSNVMPTLRRFTPWNDAKPAQSAPTAAARPSATAPVVSPMTSGMRTPTVHRNAPRRSAWSNFSCADSASSERTLPGALTPAGPARPAADAVCRPRRRGAVRVRGPPRARRRRPCGASKLCSLARALGSGPSTSGARAGHGAPTSRILNACASSSIFTQVVVAIAATSIAVVRRIPPSSTCRVELP